MNTPVSLFLSSHLDWLLLDPVIKVNLLLTHIRPQDIFKDDLIRQDNWCLPSCVKG